MAEKKRFEVVAEDLKTFTIRELAEYFKRETLVHSMFRPFGVEPSDWPKVKPGDTMVLLVFRAKDGEG